MQYPDEIIDLTQLTMAEFVGHSQHLFSQMQDDQSELDFIRFVLAARVGPLADEELDRCQVRLNCLQGIPPLPETDITRDLDSVIGVSDTLPYTSTLSIWPLPPFKETLKNDNHVKSRAYNGQVRSTVDDSTYICILTVIMEPGHRDSSPDAQNSQPALGQSSATPRCESYLPTALQCRLLGRIVASG
jgi:hypothetical protein